MNIRKASSLVFLAVLTVMLLPASGVFAGEAMYIEEPNFYSVPKTIMIQDKPEWTPDFRDNPSLMGTDKDVRFLMDLYYTGGYTKVDLDNDFTYGLLGVPGLTGFGTGSGLEEYVTNGVGADLGVVLKTSDRSELGVIMSYRYLNTDMEGDQLYRWSFLGITGNITSSLDRQIKSSDFSLGLLYNVELTPAFSLGMGLKYGYGIHESDFGLDGSGTSNAFGLEVTTMDRELVLDYHRFAPVLGVTVKPSDAWTIEASVEGGYLFGGVDKDDSLTDSAVFIPPTDRTHSEVLDSRDLSGWDIGTYVKVAYALSDDLSFPFFVDFAYMDTTWEVDGSGTGTFYPYNLPEIIYVAGPVDYENHNALWYINGGFGVDFVAGGWDMEAIAAYTHWQNHNKYDQSNVNSTALFAPIGSSSVFEEDVVERRDFISLGLDMKKEFSPALTTQFGIRYDVGWGSMDLDRDYTSRFAFVGAPVVPTLSASYHDTDLFQNLTLTVRTDLKATDRLTLTLGANGTFPIDSLNYDLDGNASTSIQATPLFPSRLDFNGPSSLDADTSEWQYGGYFMLTYELGIPKPVPPATAPAPIIEPKLEPMSQK